MKLRIPKAIKKVKEMKFFKKVKEMKFFKKVKEKIGSKYLKKSAQQNLFFVEPPRIPTIKEAKKMADQAHWNGWVEEYEKIGFEKSIEYIEKQSRYVFALWQKVPYLELINALLVLENASKRINKIKKKENKEKIKKNIDEINKINKTESEFRDWWFKQRKD